MDKRVYAAATSGNVKALTILQDNGLNIFQEVTPTNNTALHLAAYHGHSQIVRKLLQVMNRDIEAGNEAISAFLTARNMEGNTAFHEAAMGGHYQVLDALLEHDPHLMDIINNAGETALFKAAEEGHKKIVEKLLPLTSPQYDRRISDGQTLVHCAVRNEHKGVLKRFIHHKPELLKQCDNSQRTPLHYAAYHKQTLQIAKMLLDRDSSLCYQVDADGRSALHIAVKEGNVDLVREMLNFGKDCLEIVDSDGRNALHLAVENAENIFQRISRQSKALMLLVMSTRLINNPDKNGKTALDIAMESMAKDERLFTGIKRLLQRNGARRIRETVEEETRESSSAAEKQPWKLKTVSVNAVLIAGVAFQAAFNLPTLKIHGKVEEIFYVIAVICVTVAFGSSIGCAILVMYAFHGSKEDSLLLRTSVKILWIALVAVLMAFGAGIYMVVASKHLALKVVVLTFTVFGVPVGIRTMLFHSKEYVFREDENYIWTFLILAALEIGLYFIVPWTLWITVPMVTMVWIMMSMGLQRRFSRSQKHIYRVNGRSVWFLIIGSCVNTTYLLLTLALVLAFIFSPKFRDRMEST